MSELRLKSTGTIKLFENDNTSNVTIASPASLGADRTITLPDASVTLASGTMLATDGSGASLTALNASELGSGTVPTARLGSGTASSSTVLYGDQTYKAEPTGGKILQVQYVFEDSTPSAIDTTSNTLATSGIEVDITPAATDSKIYIIFETGYTHVPSNSQQGIVVNIKRDATFLGTGAQAMCYNAVPGLAWNNNITLHVVDEPSTTSEVTYSVWFSSVQPSAGTVALAGTASTYCLSALEIGA